MDEWTDGGDFRRRRRSPLKGIRLACVGLGGVARWSLAACRLCFFWGEGGREAVEEKTVVGGWWLVVGGRGLGWWSWFGFGGGGYLTVYTHSLPPLPSLQLHGDGDGSVLSSAAAAQTHSLSLSHLQLMPVVRDMRNEHVRGLCFPCFFFLFLPPFSFFPSS